MKSTSVLTVFFLLALSVNVCAQVDISGEWEGTCVSGSSGSTFGSAADLNQSGDIVNGSISIILPFTDPPTEMKGAVEGNVSGYNFTGTWTDTGGTYPDPGDFDFEISTDWNTMSGEVLIHTTDRGDITYQDFILERENPVTTTSSSSSTSSSTSSSSTSTTTTAPSQPCPSEEIYGEDSDEVLLLRSFRDNILSKTPEGQEIIRLYYWWSPVIVTAIEEDERVKEEIKVIIDRILLMIDVR